MLKSLFIWIYVIVLFIVLFIGLNIYFIYSPTQWKYHKEPRYTTVSIDFAEDSDKMGRVFSRLFKGEAFFQDAKTSGIVEDVIRVRFNRAVEVIGFLVSLDHSQTPITLVEVAATVNTKWGYELGTKSNALLHTSFYAPRFFGGVRKTDEKVFFTPGYGICLKASDFISIGAVVENTDYFKRRYVSPEFIIYYRWLEE